MKHLTGAAKYAALFRGMANRRALAVPPRFIRAMMRMMRHEKLTRVGDRYQVNTHYAPFPSPAYDAALELFARMSRGDFAPLSAYFSLTNRCVNRCAYCSNQRHEPGPDLPTAFFVDAIRQAQACGTVTIGLTGGEPLLRDDLEEIIGAVADRSYTILFTSGAGLTAERVERLKGSGLAVASVSIDSHIAEEHNRRRGSPHAYDDALNAIALFSAAGIYTTASAVLCESMQAWEQMETFADFLHDHGAQELRILRETPSGADRRRCGSFDAERVERLRREYNRRADAVTVMSLPYFESPEYCGCGAGIFHVYVDAAGIVCPCDFVQQGFGNLADEPFAAICARMRRSFRSNGAECLSMRLRRGLPLATDGELQGLLASLVNDAMQSRKPEQTSS